MYNDNIFLLPKVKSIAFGLSKKSRKSSLKKLGYDEKLNITKDKISKIDYSVWTKLRKSFNQYEFPLDKTKIKKPISRAFFKLIEMIKDNDIDVNCNTLHLAEAPGGFIESTIYKKTIQTNKHYTFSIIDKKNKDTPVYDNRIIKNKSVKILSNYKNKGDLYNISNIRFISSTLKGENIKFITCDGGFTENCDFASKEELHHRLIFHEIVTSLFVLKQKGTLIVKIFDIFTELTFDFMYLLSFLFDKVYISKPLTSRPTNSEKYVICKGYETEKFDEKIQNIVKYLCSENINNFSSFVYKNNIDFNFVEAVKNVNVKLMEEQIDWIENILNCKNKNTGSKKDWMDIYY